MHDTTPDAPTGPSASTSAVVFDLGNVLVDWDPLPAARTHPHWAEAAAAYRRNFPSSLVGPIRGTVQILGELHQQGVPVFGLTNWSVELFPAALDTFDFLGLLEDIVVSGAEGSAKPERRIYDVLVARTGRPAETLTFADDRVANVEAARAAGLDAVVFIGAGRLRADLLDRRLLAP